MSRSFVSLVAGLVAVVSLTSSRSSAAPAPSVPLSPTALGCYNQAWDDPEMLPMIKKHGLKFESEFDKVAVKMCTYSDAVGSKRCFLQASKSAEIFPFSGLYASVMKLDEMFAGLCRASREGSFNKATGEADAVECFRGVNADRSVLVAAEKHMSKPGFESLLVKLCINSNALGALTCLKNSEQKAAKVLAAGSKYLGKDAKDQILVELCMNSKLR